MTEPLLRFDDLRITFKLRDRSVEAVKGLSFDIAPGQIVALVGESGSGKSVSAMSILRLLQEPPATYPSGRILWKGEDVLRMDARRLLALRGGEVGMIFQEPMTSLNPTWTCGAQVEEALELHTDLDAAGRRARVIDLFNQVGIPQPASRIDQYPHEMSGGMRQRVCISMALACKPQLLIADEPTTALDVTIQAQILDLIRRLQKDQGMAVLFITHDLGVVAELADRVVLMRNGEKVEDGPVSEIFAAPKHPYTKGLLACRPRLGVRRDRLPTVDDFMKAENPKA
ncbi:MAG: ABC transporter ATP-binding protein [Planctomycetes bacterium]|nr:ABC transporter ATP-binding protein [Planctomycetota bacterium]